MLAGDDPVTVEFEAGQRARVGTGGEDDVRAGVGGLAHGDLVGAAQATLALDDLDATAADKTLQALVVLVDDAVLVLVDARHVDALEGGVDAEVRALAGLVGNLAGV